MSHQDTNQTQQGNEKWICIARGDMMFFIVRLDIIIDILQLIGVLPKDNYDDDEDEWII